LEELRVLLQLHSLRPLILVVQEVAKPRFVYIRAWLRLRELLLCISLAKLSISDKYNKTRNQGSKLK
jgi:hypothetical protein